MSKRRQIEEAVRAGLLPRSDAHRLLRALPPEQGEADPQPQAPAPPPVRVVPPPAPAPATPPAPKAETQPTTIVVHDSSANWRIVAAIMSGLVALLGLLKFLLN